MRGAEQCSLLHAGWSSGSPVWLPGWPPRFLIKVLKTDRENKHSPSLGEPHHASVWGKQGAAGTVPCVALRFAAVLTFVPWWVRLKVHIVDGTGRTVWFPSWLSACEAQTSLWHFVKLSLFLSFTSDKNKLPVWNAWRTWLNSFTATSKSLTNSCLFLGLVIPVTFP